MRSHDAHNLNAPIERSHIDAEVGDTTLCDVLAANAANHAHQPALAWKEGGGWMRLSWSEYRQRVLEVAAGLQRLGVRQGDHVALMMRNRPEHVIADLAVLHAGAVPVSIYNTSAPEQIAYIANDCGAKVAVVEGPEFRRRWEAAESNLVSLEAMVLLDDPAGVTQQGRVPWPDLAVRANPLGPRPWTWQDVRSHDPAALVYTSGTTAEPKGAVITHHSALWTAAATARAFPEMGSGERALSYLPLAHVLERFLSIYLALWKQGFVHFCPDPFRVFEYVPEVRPGVFVGVPRVWEKLQTGIDAALADEPHRRKRNVARGAVELGVRAARLEASGVPVPASVRIKRRVFERLVYAKIRARIGLDSCRVPATGAAPIGEGTAAFFSGIGLQLLDAFGMTETSGLAVTNRPGRVRPGTVGTPLPGVEVRLLADGELLLRGGNVVPGYHRKPHETASAIDAEGWLHTGDIAAMEADGFVRIIDRKKELLVTAGGKNVAPAAVERLLRGGRLIAHACVVGDRRPYLTALIVLDGDALARWARQHDLPLPAIADLAGDPRVEAEVKRAVDEANSHLSHPEQVKRFTVLATEWTPITGELTASLKVKRRVIAQRYAVEIETMYADPAPRHGRLSTGGNVDSGQRSREHRPAPSTTYRHEAVGEQRPAAQDLDHRS